MGRRAPVSASTHQVQHVAHSPLVLAVLRQPDLRFDPRRVRPPGAFCASNSGGVRHGHCLAARNLGRDPGPGGRPTRRATVK